MPDALRIALLSREFPPETGWGGIGAYTYNLAIGLNRAGHKVHVIAASQNTSPSITNQDGVTVHRLPLTITPKIVSARFIWRYTKPRELLLDMREHSKNAAKRLQQIKRESGLDVIEFPDWWAEGYACVTTKPKIAPSVARIHSYLRLMRRLHGVPADAVTDKREALEEVALRGADLIAPNTQWIAAELERDHGFPVSTQYVQPMGIDTAHFDAARAAEKRSEIRSKLGLPDNSVVVLSAGRIEQRKGFEHLIRAVAQLRDSGLDVRLVVAGRDRTLGVETARLNAIISELNIGERIVFPGHVEYSELPFWYGMCDIYAGASCGESPGLTYIEAMSCHRPVVAYDSGAIPEVVNHGSTGFLVAPGSSIEMVEALARLAADPDLRNSMGSSGQAHVAASFSLDHIVSQQVAMYRRAIAG